MYNTDSKRQAKKPVVPSFASASLEFGRWLAENHFDHATDRDGLTWDILVDASQVPDPNDAHGLLWQLKIEGSARANAEDLVRTKTLSVVEDARLLGILGDAVIPFNVRPKIYTVATPDQAKVLLSEVLPGYAASLAESSQTELKRMLVHRFIDENMKFGGKLCGR